MDKPMILEIEEAKDDILKSVNSALSERKIPCYFLAQYLTDIARIVTAKAEKEVEFLKQKDKKEVKEDINNDKRS